MHDQAEVALELWRQVSISPTSSEQLFRTSSFSVLGLYFFGSKKIGVKVALKCW
jgi:hypothetical protein